MGDSVLWCFGIKFTSTSIYLVFPTDKLYLTSCQVGLYLLSVSRTLITITDRGAQSILRNTMLLRRRHTLVIGMDTYEQGFTTRMFVTVMSRQ